MLSHGTFWVADIYDGDWIDEQGRREGWPAETLAKNRAHIRSNLMDEPEQPLPAQETSET